jgi:transposase
MAYSLDLRERIVEAVAEGQKHQDVAARFKVGVATVRRYI